MGGETVVTLEISRNGRWEPVLEPSGMPATVGLILAAVGAAVLVGLGLVKLLRVRRLYRAAWKNCFRHDGTWSWRRGRRELTAVANLYFGSLLLVGGASVALGILVTGAKLVYDSDLMFSSRGYFSDEASGEVATPPGILMWTLCVIVGYGLTARLQAAAITHYRRRLRKRYRQYIEVDEKRLQQAYLAEPADEQDSSGPATSPLTP